MLDGRLPPERGVEAERHLDTCRACREAFALASAQDETLDRALAHDPGDAYFEQFAERVQMKIAAGGKRTAMGGSFFGAIGDWFQVPRNLATAGAVGALVIGVGTALIVAQRTSHEVMENERLAARMEQRGGAAAPPPTAQNAPAPTPAELEQRELDAQVEPGATLGLTEEAARQAQEFRARDREGASSTTAPARAHEVRRNTIGDDERVRAEAPRAAAPQASVAPTDNVKSGLRATPLSKATAREGMADAAAARLCGEVRDPSGRPLRFASVTLVGRNSGDQTDDHGRFCLPATPGRDSLVVQLVGFQPLRTSVSLGPSATQEIRLTLEPIQALARSSRKRAESAAGTAATSQTVAEASFLSLPDSLRTVAEYAQRLTTVATRSKDARQYEAAAQQWERLLVGVAGSSHEIATRGRIAEMRYHAWEASPDPRREQAAREALTAFLVRAPVGAERNRATLWLDKVAR